MTGAQRRENILETLKETKEPIAGYKFAKELGVSRQVIVQDIALLRANKHEIMATSRGYVLYNNNNNYKKRLVKSNHGFKGIDKELRTIIDFGGRILDVVVEHEIYGEIRADLMIETERDIELFLEKMKSAGDVPMIATLTKGLHYHTVEAKNDKILDLIEDEIGKLEQEE